MGGGVATIREYYNLRITSCLTLCLFPEYKKCSVHIVCESNYNMVYKGFFVL